MRIVKEYLPYAYGGFDYGDQGRQKYVYGGRFAWRDGGVKTEARVRFVAGVRMICMVFYHKPVCV